MRNPTWQQGHIWIAKCSLLLATTVCAQKGLFDCPIIVQEQGVAWNHLLYTPPIALCFHDNRPKKPAQNRRFLDTKSAIERGRLLKTAQNLFVMMRVCSLVFLSYLDASFGAMVS